MHITDPLHAFVRPVLASFYAMQWIQPQTIMAFQHTGAGRHQGLIATTVVRITPILLKFRASIQDFVLGFTHWFGGIDFRVAQIVKTMAVVFRVFHDSTAHHAFLDTGTDKIFDPGQSWYFFTKGHDLGMFLGGLVGGIGRRWPIDGTWCFS